MRRLISTPSALLACVALTSGCAQIRRCKEPLSLRAQAPIPVGQLPLDVAVGDLNGDGVMDLLTADAKSAAVSLVLGRGDGTFITPAQTISVGVVPHLIALSDLDRDGDLDLVASDHDSASVAVWLGDGRGGFAPAAGSPFLALVGMPHNHGLAVGDISGDGSPDVITANQEDQSMSILLGDGKGGLAAAPSSPIRLGAEPYLSRLEDLDKDGKLDIVAPLVSGGALVVLQGDGQGGFSPMPGSPYRTLDRPYAVAVADLDADGNPDVLIAHDDTDKVTVLLGKGDGTLSPARGSPLSLGSRVFAMATGDVNGDGAIDVLAGAGDAVIVLVAQPGGSVSDACRTDLAVSTWTVRVGDLDGDGHLDVVSPDARANEIRVWTSSAH